MSDSSSLEAIRQSPQYQAAKSQLADREWRLDNLYHIKNEDGVAIPFRRNEAQRYYCAREWYRDTILKSRKVGFSTLIAIEILDACLFGSNTTAGIIDRTIDEAKDKLAIIKFAFDRVPASIRMANPLVTDNQTDLGWSNGSSVAAGTSYRGGTPQLLWVSEFGYISAKNPEAAREIKTGSFKSVPRNGKIWVESTPMGTSGQFYDLVKAGEQLAATGQTLTNYDHKLFFFGWHRKASNRLDVNLVRIPHELREYFDTLRTKHGIVLDGQQEAWYAKQLETLGPDDIRSEEPSTADECFYASLEGAYFKEEMNAARREKRIGYPVPYDSSRPVHSYWDLGNDGALRIGFFQTDGVRHRHIGLKRGETAGLSDGIKILRESQLERGWVWGKHYGPHDLAVRDWSAMPLGNNITAPTRKELAAEHGIEFIQIPRVGDKADAIEAARRFIAMSYFCSEYASDLVNDLDAYTRKWDKVNARWLAEPAKNGADHTADALMQAALGLQPDIVYRRDQAMGKRKGSHWSS